MHTPTIPLDARRRHHLKQALSERTHDLLIIGGGVTGAGIALEAAARGLRVALVEKGDFASGTSSRSTKLIHGGLRYLKQLDLGLVREVGRERAILYRLAPHLIRPEKMLLPIVKGGSLGRWSTMLALTAYDLLAGVPRAHRKRMLRKKAVLQEEPLLPAARLKGGASYYEYRTDDARLTLALIKTATAYGAICLNYLKAHSFIHEGSRTTGVVCTDQLSREQVEIKAHVLVNATGPWVDELRRLEHSLTGKRLFLSKGAHLVFAHRHFPVRHALYFDLGDGRMMFAIPRQDKTYVGTTDTPWPHSADAVCITTDDVQYILEGIRHMFPELHLTEKQVESSWVGLRPLIYEEGKEASEMSRKDEIFLLPSGLISIAGGKLTGYRPMARRVMKRVVQHLRKVGGQGARAARTDRIPLDGGPFADERDFQAFARTLTEKCRALDCPEHTAQRLATTWGRHAMALVEAVAARRHDTLLEAEVVFTIEHELACTPLDYFDRRTAKLYFDMPAVLREREAVEALFAERLNWDTDTRQRHHKQLEDAIAEARLQRLHATQAPPA